MLFPFCLWVAPQQVAVLGCDLLLLDLLKGTGECDAASPVSLG